jgi:hypothetical protein
LFKTSFGTAEELRAFKVQQFKEEEGGVLDY